MLSSTLVTSCSVAYLIASLFGTIGNFGISSPIQLVAAVGSSVRRGSSVSGRRHLQSSALRLTGIDLVNAATEQRVTTLTNGQVVVVSAIPGLSTPNFNLNATFATPTSIQNVVFGYNGNPNVRSDGAPPFSFCGNQGALFNTCTNLTYGTHTVTATPFATIAVTSTAGPTISVTLTIVQNAPTAPTPKAAAPVPVPIPAPTPTSAPGVAALRLVYTGSPSPHRSVINLTMGTTNVVDLAVLNVPIAAFNIDAVRSSTAVQSVQFSNRWKENGVPFAYCGNSGPTFETCGIFSVGSTTAVSVIPYPLASQKGTPFASAGATIRIIDSRLATKAPVSMPISSAPVPSPVTTAPARSPATAAPVSARPVTKSPLTQSPVTSRPITKSPTTKSPVSKSPTTKSPVSKSPTTKSPVSKSPTTKSPVSKSPTTKSPVSKSTTTKSPVSKSPTTTSPVTKAPVPLAAPVPAPTTTEGISAMRLMYTGPPAPHQNVMNLTLGGINVFDLAVLNIPSAAFSVEAVRTSTAVQSVLFSNNRPDNGAPFSLCGNTGQSFTTCGILTVGSTTTVSVIPFPLQSQQGTPFPTVSATIQIIDSRTQAPTTKAPTKAPTVPVPVAPVVPSPTVCTVPKLPGSSWQAGTKYPINIGEAQGAMIGSIFVIVSGFKDSWKATTTEAYSLDTSNSSATWQRLDDQPSPPGVTHAGYVVVNNKLYLCSGYVGANDGPSTNQCLVLDIFKPRGQQWSSIAPLPGIGQAGGGLVYDSTMNALFYAGGAARAVGSKATIDSDKTWMYAFNNVAAGWQPRAPIPFQANHMSFVTAKDGNGVERHFFVGGQEAEDEESGNIMSHYEYDASLNVWTERQPLPFPRGHTSSSTRPVSCGYIMIGGTTNGWSRVPDVSFYGIDTNTWTKIGELPFGINTPVCDINRATNMLYCESGGATFPYSHKRQMVL